MHPNPRVEYRGHVVAITTPARRGASLGLSALTVKSHLARIARKLGTGDRAAMTYTALRRGLIT